MIDTRLSNDELDLMVSVAYGGAAYRAGREAQARAINNLLTGKPIDGEATAQAPARKS
jgi:hypothetical protein